MQQPQKGVFEEISTGGFWAKKSPQRDKYRLAESFCFFTVEIAVVLAILWPFYGLYKVCTRAADEMHRNFKISAVKMDLCPDEGVEYACVEEIKRF